MAAEILTAMVTPMLNAVTTKLLGIREIGLPQRIDRVDRFAHLLKPARSRPMGNPWEFDSEPH